jgi:glycine oxidase
LPDRSSSFDVAVVGGGVIGLSVGWRAAQRGMSVIVLERAEPGGGASWVAAGMIAPISEARPKEQSLLRLSLESARAYPEFVAELSAASGRDPGYLACGTLAAARDRDEGGDCAQVRRAAWSRASRRACGLHSTSPTTT